MRGDNNLMAFKYENVVPWGRTYDEYVRRGIVNFDNRVKVQLVRG